MIGCSSPSTKTVYADAQRRPDVAAARRQWHTGQPLRDVRQYVFLDECGVTTDLLRRYGRSQRGVRLHDHTPCSHWQTHTVVAALRLDGLGAPAVFDGPIDTPTFLAYIEQVLVPHGAAQMRISFEQACDVREIFLALTPSARGVLGGPNLSLKHIVNSRNRHLHTKNIAWSRPNATQCGRCGRRRVGSGRTPPGRGQE